MTDNDSCNKGELRVNHRTLLTVRYIWISEVLQYENVDILKLMH